MACSPHDGDHVLAWNMFREHGPHLRFDPHPPPARRHDGIGVWYGGSGPTPALAEAFQVDRTIDRFRGDPYLTGLRFTRQMRLLDFTADSTGAWPTRAGGTFALSTGPHSITQRWARRITEAFPSWTVCATTADSPAHRASRFSAPQPLRRQHDLCCLYR